MMEQIVPSTQVELERRPPSKPTLLSLAQRNSRKRVRNGEKEEDEDARAIIREAISKQRAHQSVHDTDSGSSTTSHANNQHILEASKVPLVHVNDQQEALIEM